MRITKTRNTESESRREETISIDDGQLADHVEKLFGFVLHPEVEATNNRSERQARSEAMARKGNSHQQDRIWGEATRRNHERFNESFETPGAYHVRQCHVGNQPLDRNGTFHFPGRTRHASRGNRRSIQRVCMKLWRVNANLPPSYGQPTCECPYSFGKWVLQVFSWVFTVFVLSAGSSGCVSATAGLVPAHWTMFITCPMAGGRMLSGPTAQAFA